MKFLVKVNEEKFGTKMAQFRYPTIEEWKTGKYQETEKRQIKLGKTLLKVGFSQTVVDFYSLQTKTEKEIFLTISDLPQHVVGMSRLAKVGAFDGMNGTSCQDVRWNGRYPMALGGALNDNKLFVGMLHEDLEDIEDMQDKLVARTVFRYMTIDSEPCLIATYYYGQNDTKDILHKAIEQLDEVNVFSKEVRGGDYGTLESIQERANGYLEINQTIEVHIEETIEEDVTCECPMCNGSGNYEVYSHGNYHTVDCPACGGDGDYCTSVYIDVDEYVDVEIEEEIQPYAEGYGHYGYYIRMDVNVKMIRDLRLKHAIEKAENEIQESFNL
jgi:hypothetical protein